MHDISLLSRFWAKVDKNGPAPAHWPALGPCWVWTASLGAGGYGKIWATKKAFVWTAHRLSYDIAFGLPSDPTLVLDHLCRNRRCVNPGHLEAVTQRMNTLRGSSPSARQARQSHCKNGHEFTPENTYRWRGQPLMRKCRICRTEYLRRRRTAA